MLESKLLTKKSLFTSKMSYDEAILCSPWYRKTKKSTKLSRIFIDPISYSNLKHGIMRSTNLDLGTVVTFSMGY